jgi:hypothetical protein
MARTWLSRNKISMIVRGENLLPEQPEPSLVPSRHWERPFLPPSATGGCGSNRRESPGSEPARSFYARIFSDASTPKHLDIDDASCELDSRRSKLIYFARGRFIFCGTVADVAELADALNSKSDLINFTGFHCISMKWLILLPEISFWHQNRDSKLAMSATP